MTLNRYAVLTTLLGAALTASAWDFDKVIATDDTVDKADGVGEWAEITHNGKTVTGKYLMEIGFEVPLDREYASRVYSLTEI